MGLAVEIPGLDMNKLRVQAIKVERRVGSPATASLIIDAALVASQSVPDPATLRGKPMSIRAHSSVEIIDDGQPPVFAGSINDVEVVFWSPDRLRVTVAAMEGPLACSVAHEQRAAWRSFAKDRPLKDALQTLMEETGFKDVQFVKAVEDKLPAELLCAGVHPWEFFQGVAYVHAVGLAMRPGQDGALKFVLARTAGELAVLGTTRTIALTPQGGSRGLRTAKHVAVLHRRLPTEAGVNYWDADSETFGMVGPKDRRSRRPHVVKAAGAKKMQEWQKGRDRAQDILVLVVTNDPEISIGDKLNFVGDIDTAQLGWMASRLSGEALCVIGVTLVLDSTEAQLVTTTIEAVPVSAPAVQWSQNSPASYDHRGPGTLMLSGEVLAMPAGQGQMKVALDVTDTARPEVHCDWMSPCLSGDGGGLHMPPLPGDRVKLLCEAVPYGRIIYIGAVAGNSRLAKIRKAIAGRYDTERPTDGTGKGSPPIQHNGNHLVRAIAASPKNLTVWMSPGAGLSSDASEEEAAQWSVISSGSHQITKFTKPGLEAMHHAGSGALQEKKYDGPCLIESAAGMEIKVKEELKVEAKNTTMKSEQALSVSAGQTAELTSPATTIKGTQSLKAVSDAAAELSGGTVDIKGSSLINQQAALIKLNS